MDDLAAAATFRIRMLCAVFLTVSVVPHHRRTEGALPVAVEYR